MLLRLVFCWLLALPGVALLASACADSASAKPELQPLEPATVAVNETLRLELVVTNPSGLALEYSFSGPELPGMAEVTTLSGTPSGGEFRWTPLSSHVGTHELVFEISSRQGRDTEAVLVTVEPPSSAAPIFLRPGAGGTFDLARDPCVRFEIEVRDDDSTDVDIRLRGLGGPEGSQLIPDGPKRAAYEWCPRADQVDASERWTIPLEADDGAHDPTLHDYLAVLRTQGRDNCSGAPPTITVVFPSEAELVASQLGYDVVITVTDDVGVREAPLLYYSTVAPADESNPDVTSFDQLAFREAGAEWEATVPSLGLSPDQQQTVYFVVSATDNDDPNGTACDHRSDSPLRRFVAVGEEGTPLADVCEPCTASIQCASGVCAGGGGGGTCLPTCDPGGSACSIGTCAARTTTEGATPNACGDAVAVCQGGGSCEDDPAEDNDTRESAPRLAEDSFPGMLCAGDEDYYRIDLPAETEVTVTLEGFDPQAADLDLELLDGGGATLGVSAGTGPTELTSACLAEAGSVYAHVFSVIPGDQSAYDLIVDQVTSDCCINDFNEPDDEVADAVPMESDFFEGMICPSDHDHHSFVVDVPSQLSALILFEHDEADLDLELFGPTGAFVDGSYSTADEEEIIVDLTETGRYVLRVTVYGEGSGEYLGQIVLTAL